MKGKIKAKTIVIVVFILIIIAPLTQILFKSFAASSSNMNNAELCSTGSPTVQADATWDVGSPTAQADATASAACFSASPTSMSNETGPANFPVYNPPPRVDPGNNQDTTNLTYLGGPVIDGVVNVYLIFWVDAQVQQPTPNYISLVTRFFQDVNGSPLYANLLQYTDSRGRYPTGVNVAGSFTDQTTPFPADAQTISDPGGYFHQEVISVATQQNWDYHNVHNLFFVFPTFADGGYNGCGSHGYLGDRPDETNIQNGSPIANVLYPYANGQERCAATPQSPNNDHIADIAINAASHELMEAVSDPYLTGWASNGEMGDKCISIPPDTIDPNTNGNVTWNGNNYLVQEEWDNLRNGCVLEGP